jgi:hypothetical protein
MSIGGNSPITNSCSNGGTVMNINTGGTVHSSGGIPATNNLAGAMHSNSGIATPSNSGGSNKVPLPTFS